MLISYNQAQLRADFVLGMAQRCLFTENGRVLDEVAAERVRHRLGADSQIFVGASEMSIAVVIACRSLFTPPAHSVGKRPNGRRGTRLCRRTGRELAHSGR